MTLFAQTAPAERVFQDVLNQYFADDGTISRP